MSHPHRILRRLAVLALPTILATALPPSTAWAAVALEMGPFNAASRMEIRGSFEAGPSPCRSFEVAGGTLELFDDPSFDAVIETGDFLLAPGTTLSSPDGELELRGSFINQGATVVLGPDSEVRIVDGCGNATSEILGSTQFNDLTITSGNGRRVELQSGQTTTVTGTLTMLGAPGDDLIVRSTVTGIAAFLDKLGGSVIEYVNVNDVNATGGELIPVDPSTTLGGSTPGWVLALVAEDFDVVDVGGVGWAGGSSWNGALDYFEDYAIDPNSLQHARTRTVQTTVRAIDSAVAAALDLSPDVWIAFDARLEDPLATNQFAGLSLFSGGTEEYFLGAPFDLTSWGGAVIGGTSLSASRIAGAEWASLMAHFDFDAGNLDLYVNGELFASDTSLPLRGWDGVRLTDGTLLPPVNPMSIDRLRIGTSRRAVEPDVRPRFVAAQWSDDSVRLLNGNRTDTGDFPAGATDPNGIATDGFVVYTAHFSSDEVVAYDLAGSELYRWPLGTGGGEQGMDFVGRELAVHQGTTIDFRDPVTGAVLRSRPTTCGFPEGLAYEEGAGLWQICGATLQLIDPFTSGPALATIPNVASGCTFGATGITASAPGELTLACTTGDWFRVSSADGSVIEAGNNGNDMYGIKAVPEPGFGLGLAISLVALRGLAARTCRRQERAA